MLYDKKSFVVSKKNAKKIFFMTRPILLTDIDGVVLDYDHGFSMYLKERGYDSYSDFWKYEDFDAQQELVQKFNHSDHFSKLPIFNDAKEYLNEMSRKGYAIVAITACGDHSEIIKKRTQNLASLPIDELICLPLSSSKKSVLEKYTPTIWIEDSYNHALDGANWGHTVYLKKTEWTPENITHSNIVVVKHLLEILEVEK